jgi:hypothetical protein
VLAQLPEPVNQRPIDAYSAGHFAVGFALAQARIPWWGALASTIAWERGENLLKANLPRLFPYATKDSTINSILDSVFFMGGWLLGRLITYGKLTGSAR